MKFLITNIDYTIENNELIVRAYGRSEDGSRKIVRVHGTRPFFLVRADKPIPEDSRITGTKDSWVDLKGKPLKVIYVRYPKDVAQRVKCRECSGEGRVVVNGSPIECAACKGAREIEIGVKGKFTETWQADVVYTQILRIYYGLVGEVEVPSTDCHVSEIRKV